MRNVQLRMNARIAVGAEDIHHHGVGRHQLARDHLEEARSDARDEGDALLVHLDRLLAVAALDVPEHHLRQLVAVLGEV